MFILLAGNRLLGLHTQKAVLFRKWLKTNAGVERPMAWERITPFLGA
jgi:hypothetical protein